MKNMSEFKLLVKLPFTEDVSVKTFDILTMFADTAKAKNFVLFQVSNIACTGGTSDAPKTIFVTATMTKLGTAYHSLFRQFMKSADSTSPSGAFRECVTADGNLFAATKMGFKFQLKSYPIPVGTYILLEGR
jgi:hypothetical protein